jgi:hypothetical protein
LKVNDGNSRIQIHLSQAWIRGSGSTPKCHVSATLVVKLESTYISSSLSKACNEKTKRKTGKFAYMTLRCCNFSQVKGRKKIFKEV